MPVTIIIMLLPLVVGGVYFLRYLDRRKKYILEYKREVKEIQKKFYLAIQMQFLRTPLVARTEREVLYYEGMLLRYGNPNRKVKLMSPNLGETKADFRNRIDVFVSQYCTSKFEAIEQGQEAYSVYFEEIRKKGLLAYFKSPYGTEKSRAFIYAKIDSLTKDPKVEYGDCKKPNEVYFQ